MSAGMNTDMSEATSRQPVIVHVLDQFEIGGMETVALNVIAGSRERYRHVIVCLRGRGMLAPRAEALGADVHAVDKNAGKDIGAYLRLRRLLRRLNPDLVHTYNIGALDVAFWARLAGVKRVVHAEHGRDVADPQGRNPKYRRLRRLMAPLIRAFVPVSADLERWLIEDVGIARAKVNLIRNGIDIERFRPVVAGQPRGSHELITAGDIVIGSVGRLDAVKAFATLIDAFARLAAELPDQPLRLLLVGDGPERHALAQQAIALGLGDRVVLAGARDDVPQLLQAMDVYVCSSIAEGIALTILEAMGTALPVVATAVGGNPELVVPGDTGTLVPASDATALADALRAFVVSPGTIKTAGQAGRERVCEQFSLDAMTARYCQLYDRVLGSAAPQTAVAPLR